MPPIITVVIPAYNEERYLAACLQSLREQDFSLPFEILVVDNGSTDSTASIAAGFGARVITESQRGVCAARQAGTIAALANIVVSTDADTVFSSDWLSSIYHDFQTHPDIVAVAGTVSYRHAPWWAGWYTKLLFGFNQFIFQHTGRVKYITACNTAFRTSAWTGYNTQLSQGGDEFGLLQQLSARGPILFRRQNIVSTSSRRLNQGLLYNLFVTILLYYIVDYTVGRLLGRSIFGSYAPIRDEQPVTPGFRIAAASIAVMAVLFFSFTAVLQPARAARFVRNTGSRIDAFADHVHIPHIHY
jgi:glycosyltransferase involved in cell wall biosynthesis